ncbi:MAG: flagella basal body P-ring formation protein FlgA [Alphaproteobacteria bacterium CG_4_10_14_0_8_um_filter_53_9]|nr:MAG: flagella basal body P-ring formation protein FlgA [Alphaproteobacteria bacterium CG_4_10_14_0_8_um_filter_53_9]
MKKHLALLTLCPLLAYGAVMVPVSNGPLSVGDKLTDNVSMQEVEDGRVFAGTIKNMEELEGMVAKRSIKPGVPILRTHIKQDYPVNRNSSVTFTYQRGGIQLTGTATALEEGSLGESVKILNPDTRTTLAATVTGPAQVKIQ